MKVAASPHSFLIPLFSLLPLEGGAPKGRRLALDAVFHTRGCQPGLASLVCSF